MIHASVELVEAMRGEVPPGHTAKVRVACGSPNGGLAVPAFFWSAMGAYELKQSSPRKFGRSQPLHVVTCPACLRLMRDATPPVRWDHLETLGLAPKLGAT